MLSLQNTAQHKPRAAQTQISMNTEQHEHRPGPQQLLISPILILLQQYLNKKPQRTNFIKIKDISENVVSDPQVILEDIDVVSGEACEIILLKRLDNQG